VTGGDYDEFYLTGLYRGDVSNYDDNAECYINGGRFGILAGAGQEGIGNASNHTNGNIVWQIQNADIDEFYGGGFNAAHPVEGNITTVITGGYIKQFCGGPKFGDMSTGKTVKTTATNCIFDNFYGAGYGGNSYSRRAPSNKNSVTNTDWNGWVNGNDGYKQNYNATYGGVETQYTYQFLPMSDNNTNVARLLVEYVSFSLATARDVTSTLTGCTINNSFYGGGRLGKVDGPVTSTLTNCTVSGSAFGAGYSASLPTVEVMNTGGFQTEPYYNTDLGIYLPAVFPETVTYTWEHAATVNSTATAINTTTHKLFTTADLTTLGEVTGKATLTIDGTTTVAGNVYGGGESSDATGDVEVNVKAGTMTDVYGGGMGQTTVVGGDIVVNIGAKDGSTLSGTGSVSGNVYGGSALGTVNAKKDDDYDKDTKPNAISAVDGKETKVYIYGGTVNGSVFGGGLGDLAALGGGHADVAAQNFGDATVNVEGGAVTEAVYGGANVNGVLKQNATVTLLGGTVGTEDEANDVVFGGGKGEPTLVEGDVTVNIGTKTGDVYAGNVTLHGNVYGGSALGNTNASRPASELVFNSAKKTEVNLYGGTINGSAYGGGLGRKTVVAAPAVGTEGDDDYVPAVEAVEGVESFVGGDVYVTLDGAKVQQVFGANNLNGTPKGHVKVWVKRTNNFSSNDYKNISTTALADRTTYDVTAVYGGGNQADYNPTKATGTDEEKKEAYAEVVIDGCTTTSIEYVYGGGNAAAVPATEVTINGAYIIDKLFGGGNGAGNPGADVGIIDKTAYASDPTTGIYGTGQAVTKLIGGQIHEVYGGSNTLGNIRGGTTLERKDNTGDCDLKIGELYGAGQLAPMDGDVNLVLECMPESFVDAVYGGAKNAEINGNVSLTVTSGKFGRVFGGNNEGGSINGSITVNVYEDGCEPLIIGELYGGGYQAPYSIYGCTQSGNTWTPNESGTPYFGDKITENRVDVGVYVYSCTSIGKVFGGGYEAPVIGNTHVWINMMKGTVDGTLQSTIGKIGQVFGGGNAAPVTGNTTIDIGTATVYGYNSEDPATDIGVNITSGDYLSPTSDTNTSITAGVYGGGYSADVDGNTTINIGTVDQNQGINIEGDIFGGGYGEKTTVTGDVEVNIGKRTNTAGEGEPAVYSYEGYATITGDVYGGSAKGKVNATKGGTDESPTFSATEGKTTHVNLYGGTITGNIYGGGQGQRAVAGPPAVEEIAAHVYGPVTVTMEKGSTTNTIVNNVFGCNNFFGAPQDTVAVIINGGTVNHSVYGGGDEAEYTAPAGKKNYPALYFNNGSIAENVFGGGLGTSAVVTGNPQVTIGDTDANHTATVGGSVYGGGDAGKIAGNTSVYVQNTNTKIAGNVFGGGKGRDDTFTCEKAMVGLEESGNACVEPDADDYKDKGTKVVITNGTIGTLSGGNLVAGTGNVYGGGEIGRVEWNTQVEIGIGTGEGTFAPVIEGSVFGAGKGLETHGYAALVRGNSSVTIGGNAKIGKNVYGGGEIATVGRYWVTSIPADLCDGESRPAEPTGLPSGMPYLMRRGGKSTVVIQDKADIGYHGVADDAGHVFGAGRGVNPNFVASGEGVSQKMANSNMLEPFESKAKYLEFLETLALVSRSSVTINGCNIKGNVYGGSESGFVQTNSSVTIKGTSVIGTEGSTTYGNVFGGGKGLASFVEAGKVRGETVVDISDGIIYGNVFGGGQQGYVMQNVTVNVSGGQVVNDVYGGGALANTNTANWNTEGSATEYVEVTGLTPEAYAVKSVTVGESVVGLYTLDNGNYIAATGTAASGTTYYERTVQGSSVAGYYTRSGSEGSYVYTLVTTGAATSGTKYFKKKVKGEWAEGMNGESGTTYKTKVILTGGLIGNVYGGGLGQLANGDLPAIAAMVYGDVKITVNDPEVIGTAPGVAFTQNTTNITYGEGDKQKEYVVPLTGRVFGCNNQNGTPTGNVRVEVYSTRQIDANNNIISGHGSSNRKYPNEIRAVYGGGNLSDYLPADGKGTSVYIEGCDVTSIEKVYGGGNSASVPTTDVTIKSCYDVGYAFGGGNGGDLIYKNGNWTENEGAIVIGLAKITPMGGKIGQVFGGSDAKGVCGNTTVDLSQQSESTCPLVLTRIYGAGNEADVSGDVNMIISGCGSGSQTIGDQDVNTQIEYVYGGSYNAHITGNVTLTISSGIFKYVYGGNDRTGSIGGNITVNIEERDDCNPIIIENLLGGGNEAAYPGTRRDGTEITTAGKITVNVKSATYIGSVYGGSYKADVNGDTEVNINMTKGLWAGAQAPAGYSDLPNVNHASYAKVVSPVTAQIGDYYEKIGEAYTKTSDVAVVSGKTYYVAVDANADVIDDAVGVIGTVYGGGNQGVVRGSSIVNIGTATTVQIIDVVTQDGGKITDISYKPAPVLGARITGDVFGGGNEANINLNTTVNICTADHSGTTGFEGINIEGGSVYGGGNASDVLGNTTVTMGGGYVFDGVYGGGLLGNVGTVRSRTDGKPNFAASTGKCTVVISGGQVGPAEVAGHYDSTTGTVLKNGGMKNTGRYFKETGDPDGPVDVGFVFGAGRGEVEDPATDPDADFRTYVNETDVTISGGIIMASVYGGGENGRVRTNTLVKIRGGQIGCGEGKVDSNNKPVAYTEDEWSGEEASHFTECASWDYGKTVGTKTLYLPYDPLAPADTENSEASTVGSDGHTYYGSVFGGGSGYYPYMKADGTHDWLRSAGMVEGNTEVLITGGHILTCVYGGNELTDVTGKATVKMTGGTLGVPRKDDDAKGHPVTCYLFGGGKGDQRTRFNTWTNVGSSEVEVSGTARIFGSVFGGAEDGHVMGNVTMTIGKDDHTGPVIGTRGTSYVDGNIFGAGRGYSGEALTAGSVHGNIELTIKGGTMLGSVYGGGRLASVGIDMVDATLADGSPNPAYGLLKDDTDSETCGHITVSITGGTIGNDVAGAEYGGNVFGGSMGRLTLLDGTTNPLWPKLAASKLTNVTISGGTIKRNVYGGSEYGIVRNRATVNVSGGTINGSVFGSGRGSENTEKQTIAVTGYDNFYYTFTPMLWAGCVSGSTFVNISGGTVKKNVYGGGELASVGLIDFVSDANGNFTKMTKHESLTNGFGLSWPYEFHYHSAAPSDLPAVGGKEIGGKATVTIIGGKIGDASNAESGYVFGGGMGKPMERYTEAFMANVRETEVSIKYASTATALSDDNCITGAVYGGGENGHVYENSAVNITGGLIGYSVYGGGKGIDKYKATLKNWKDNGATTYKTDIYSITAGKVYGNTSVTMSGGHVMRNVYGGGYMASVGKGNYAGGADDYSDFTSEKFGHMSGYGETITDNLWDGVSENSQAFLNSGKATVTITGGTVGTPVGEAEDEFGGLPTGNVIGGSKGEPAPNIFNMPVHEYNPTFHVGNINEAEVIIGDKDNIGTGPRIYASVYGGGQDGHMRRDSKVTIYGGEIGIEYTAANQTAVGTSDLDNLQWEHRGNVYGSGSGIGKFEYDYNGNGTTGADQYYEFDSDGDGTAEKHYEVGMSHLAGCVARFSEVNILGGTIHRSVYGGGSVAGTGMPKFYGQNYEPYKKGDTAEGHGQGYQSQNTVTISGNATIGEVGYGGNVFGASRGERELMVNPNSMFATSIWSDVNIQGGTIYNNVYGGGELGTVTQSTNVQLTGGEIKNNAYGGGKGIKADANAVEANIGGNTTVELNKGKAAGDNGCIVKRIFGCNDQNGTPKGHALVHVYATQHSGKTRIVPDDGNGGFSKIAKFKSMEGGYTTSNYTDNTNADDLKKLATTVGLTSAEISTYETAISSASGDNAKKAALDNYIEAIADRKYDVLAVYGGGDLAIYKPTNLQEENTDVIIDGCALTSIKQVYGGGNAASTPANRVRINAAYEIHEAFGGGNGKDAYELNGKWYENPGANVGYYATFHHDTSGEGTPSSPYTAVANEDADTPEERRANTSYHYGKGTADLIVTGGRVHMTYGGSNTRGNVRAEVVTSTENAGDCPMEIDKSYPAGKNADTDASSKLNARCVDYQSAIYGGAQNANVYSDVVINITNGTYGAVYGGNDTSGKIMGSITINVQEEGCKPIVIGELFAGGKGVNAPYSIYGYKGDGTIRTKEDYDALTPEQKAAVTVRRDPQINIISATKIGTIYGGGDEAKMYGSPTINVNMENGFVAKKYVDEAPDKFTVRDYSVTEHDMDCSYTVEKIDTDGKAVLKIGTIGFIYGGGKLADIEGDTYVEIGTGKWLNSKGQRETTDAEGKIYTYNNTTEKWDWVAKDGDEITSSGTVDAAPVPARNAANITGNVFGGGKGVALESGSRAFFCESAMVGSDGDGVEHPDGGTSVIIANGSVAGNVYGGGEIGRVEKNTVVTIGVEGEVADDSKFKPVIEGSVFGAGKGVATHGYSGLTRGNSTVTIQGLTKVLGSIYSGGELATVGKYNVVDGIPVSPLSGGVCTVTVKDNAEIGPDNMQMTADGGPDDAGHVFGGGKGVVPGIYTYADNEHKPWSMDNTNAKKYYDNDEAYLKFIETLGLASNTNVTINGNAFVKGSVYGGAENGFVQQNTHVTIDGDCQIGNGYVQMNAAGEPLASPYSLNRRYTEKEWTDGHLEGVAGYENALPECASWPYASPWAPYDKFANETGDLDKYSDGTSTEGGRRIGSDGHTFYGNVFGGGSGYYPYAPGKWHEAAGSVGGNTVVDIKGGHILTNVYGGNEMTNVTGNATVNFGGTATLGVPRTLGQIAAHPVTCYLFGGGKGDQRIFFNKSTNVENAYVNITGGTIYGSVFGGGEDGHVMGNVTMNIGEQTTTGEGDDAVTTTSGPTIGTWGTSNVDGNVFGGGRGFGGDAYTAGNVAGSVTLNIKGGTMLGSVYGGGRLASVGYGLYMATETEEATGHKMYGEIQDDGYGDWYLDGSTYVHPEKTGFKRGYVTINISGGTIGNDHEYKFPSGITTDAALTEWKATNHIPNTEYNYDSERGYYMLKHTKGGNVFAGGMGRMYQLDNSTPIAAVDWWRLGRVKSTKLTITGGTIKSNVYGGGELGWVDGSHTAKDDQDQDIDVSTEINISGSDTKIGSDVTDGSDDSEVTRYTFGSVYGGGYGNLTETLTHDGGTKSYPKFQAGRVTNSTRINMQEGTVLASVYGGGEVANVGYGFWTYKEDETTNEVPRFDLDSEDAIKKVSTFVTVSGGTIGKTKDETNNIYYGGPTMGNIFGGGNGNRNIVRCGLVLGNTYVNVKGSPTIYHNIYGGGAYGSVGDIDYHVTEQDYVDPVTGVEVKTKKVEEVDGLKTAGTGITNVNITGGTIGIDGHNNGMVFGSSRGDIANAAKRDDYMAWVGSTHVTIGTLSTESEPHGIAAPEPQIKGSVYGSGENGHTFTATNVTVNSGKIGIDTEATETDLGAGDPDRGNVYGGGCGTDKYVDASDDNKEKYNPLAGIVYGNTNVTINGGYIVHNVYGAGSMASVGRINTTSFEIHDDAETGFALSWPFKYTFADNTGKATININGGHIGTTFADGGDVYGSARGEAGDRYETASFALVREAEVNVNYSATADVAGMSNPETPCITGSVHGSGQNGYVYGDTKVTLNKGLIGHSLYGAGKGNGTYEKKLLKIGVSSDKEPKEESDYYTANIYSLIAGKVMGNTYVTMNGGHVGRNVYGGGNLGSVGKGNYASGTDDYYPEGYGEKINEALWTHSEDFDPDKPIKLSTTPGPGLINEPSSMADYFLSSGKTFVKVLGGTVGYIDADDPTKSTKNNLPYGNVFGGSAGEAAPNVPQSLTPRYEYCPAFFSGYVNETDVTIGKAGTAAVGTEGEDGYVPAVAASGPTILGSVYGGGEDGHVRRWANVKVYGGVIGLPCSGSTEAMSTAQARASANLMLTSTATAPTMVIPSMVLTTSRRATAPRLVLSRSTRRSTSSVAPSIVMSWAAARWLRLALPRLRRTTTPTARETPLTVTPA